ncbi:hypothetical protein EAI_10549 [Harpegnathos saltator]|uniref:Uncharacterized protein n=1 Tax=Harpegnathos saltator TaxID=610380 RepID=E2B7Q2_HARSA|nr:hypothetical protein EAI_10549 [Harpegnathos saltator]
MNITPKEVNRKIRSLRSRKIAEKESQKDLNNDGKSRYSLRLLSKGLDKQKNTIECIKLDETEETQEKFSAQFLNGTYSEETKHLLQIRPKAEDEEKNIIGEYMEFNERGAKRRKISDKFSNIYEESKQSSQFLPEEERNTFEFIEYDEIEDRHEKIPIKFLNGTCNEEPKHSLRCLPKIPNEERNTIEYVEIDGIEERCEKIIPTKYVNINCDEESRHSSRFLPKIQDEDDRFGEYVALELRSLRSEASKRRLKSEIRRAICHIADLDDADIFMPNAAVDPLSLYSQSFPNYSQMCEISNIRSEIA